MKDAVTAKFAQWCFSFVSTVSMVHQYVSHSTIKTLTLKVGSARGKNRPFRVKILRVLFSILFGRLGDLKF